MDKKGVWGNAYEEFVMCITSNHDFIGYLLMSFDERLDFGQPCESVFLVICTQSWKKDSILTAFAKLTLILCTCSCLGEIFLKKKQKQKRKLILTYFGEVLMLIRTYLSSQRGPFFYRSFEVLIAMLMFCKKKDPFLSYFVNFLGKYGASQMRTERF